MYETQAGALAAVAALDEPTRRRLYEYVVRRPEPVSRDDVAAALGVPRATVAFHLDRLVEERLLAVGHERRTGRSGRAAGPAAGVLLRTPRAGLNAAAGRTGTPMGVRCAGHPSGGCYFGGTSPSRSATAVVIALAPSSVPGIFASARYHWARSGAGIRP